MGARATQMSQIALHGTHIRTRTHTLTHTLWLSRATTTTTSTTAKSGMRTHKLQTRLDRLSARVVCSALYAHDLCGVFRNQFPQNCEHNCAQRGTSFCNKHVQPSACLAPKLRQPIINSLAPVPAHCSWLERARLAQVSSGADTRRRWRL